MLLDRHSVSLLSEMQRTAEKVVSNLRFSADRKKERRVFCILLLEKSQISNIFFRTKNSLISQVKCDVFQKVIQVMVLNRRRQANREYLFESNIYASINENKCMNSFIFNSLSTHVIP